MKNLSKIQFELLNFTVFISPFILWNLTKINNPNLYSDGVIVFFGIFLWLMMNAAFVSMSFSIKDESQQVNYRFIRFAFSLFISLAGFVFIKYTSSKVKSDFILFKDILLVISIFLTYMGNYLYRVKSDKGISDLGLFKQTLSLKLNRVLSKTITLMGILGFLIYISSFFIEINFLQINVWFIIFLVVSVVMNGIYTIFSTPKSLRFNTKNTI